jgi:predicted phosphodiesterase
LVAGALTRIISDLHYGERGSRVTRLNQLRPLLDGVDHLVLNGDTLDTRPGPRPAHTAECRAEVLTFFPRVVAATTFLTGNHDADISPLHQLDLAAGEVFATHGDILFDAIVPWSKDAPRIRQLVLAELQALPAHQRDELPHRLAVFKRVAASIPQRHQSEPNLLKYALHYLVDSVWPPARLLRVLRAWRQAPQLAAEHCRRHRPKARFVLSGHTHRPGIWRSPQGVIAINTGSFCPPLTGWVVDLTESQLTVRTLAFRHGEVRAGDTIQAFPLAGPRHLAETRA